MLSRARVRLRSGFGDTLAANVLNLALGVITGVLTARGLPPADRGELIALVLWSGAIATVALVGLDEALIYGSQGHDGSASALARSLTRPALTQSGVGAIALAAISVFIIEPESFRDWVLVLLVSSIVPLNAANQLLMSPLRAVRRTHVWNLLRVVPQVVYAGGATALLLAHHITVFNGIAVLVAGVFVTTVCAFYVRLRSVDGYELHANVLSDVRAYGRRLLVASLPAQLAPRIDGLLLGALFASELLGVYAVATSIAGIVLVLAITLDQVLFPRWVAQGSSVKVVQRALVLSILFATSISLLIALFAGPAIRVVYGRGYVEAVDPLRILLVGVTLRVGAAVLTARLKARGDLRRLTRANVGGLVAGVATFVALTPSFGMSGAAWSSVISASVTFLVVAWPWSAETSPRDEVSQREP